VGFDSFWDVYNQVCDAVDSDFLFRSNTGAFDEENPSGSEDPGERPLQHLEPCEFGKDGIPSARYEGGSDALSSYSLPELSSSLRAPRILCQAQSQSSRYGSLKIRLSHKC